MTIDKGDLLMLVLEQNLPFTFAESPRLSPMARIDTDWKSLSQYAEDAHQELVTVLKDKLTRFDRFGLVRDEWSDAKHRQFVGIKAHCINDTSHTTGALDQIPLDE